MDRRGRDGQLIVINKTVVVTSNVPKKVHGIGNEPRANGDGVAIGIVLPGQIV